MNEIDLGTRWRALAEKAVGGSLNTLRHVSDDGLVVEPLSPRRQGDEPRPWRQCENWAVSQRVDNPNPPAANRSALLDLEGGADALTLVCAGSPFARGFGVEATRSAFDVALANVELDLISFRLDAGHDTLDAAAALADLAVDRRLTSAGLDIDLGFDPIGWSSRTGGRWQRADLTALRETAQRAGLAGRPFLADGRPYHEAGAGEAQELSAVLATGVAYLRHLEASGLDLAAARDGIAVLLPVDANVFLGLAKTRAIRRLWARIEAACGLEPKALRLHAETSWRAMTRYDPWMNVLRAAAGVCAAGLGGADTITVLPMSLTLGLPDDWTRRLARNTGRVLLDEANLAKVDDPAAGSGGIEALTDRLCEQAWALFQIIEALGGVEQALSTGDLPGRISETARKRSVSFGTLGRGIVGTSHYASLAAADVAVVDTPRRQEVLAPSGPLPARRDAEPFEALRDEAEVLAAAGDRPTILLTTLGAPASSGARMTYAINFFAVAGIAAIELVDPATIRNRAPANGSRIVCLCGMDGDYAEHGEVMIKALRDAGATDLFMVGCDETWRTKGIDSLIHDGANALQVLEWTLKIILRNR